MWKISRGDPLNLEKWTAKFGKICCGTLWSLDINVELQF